MEVFQKDPSFTKGAPEAPTAGCLVLPEKKTFPPPGSLRKGLPTLEIEPFLLGLSNTLPFRLTFFMLWAKEPKILCFRPIQIKVGWRLP